MWLLLLLTGAQIHPPSQNTSKWGDVGGGGGSVRGHPATECRRVGEVAEAVAALGRRADLGEGGSGEGGAAAGILRFEKGKGRE